MKLTIIVKRGKEVLLDHTNDKEARYVTLEDVAKLIEMEPFLEKMFGLRFHFRQEP